MSESGNMPYFISVTQAHEEERHRISRELHDEITQGLSSIGLGLELVMMDLEKDTPIYSALEQLQLQAQDLTKQVRRISQDLRPPALDSFGLVPSLRQFIKRYGQQKNAPQVTLHVEGEMYRQPATVELALFRVVQEALSNAYKHAHAQQVSVTMVFTEQDIEVAVQDDGHGFTSSPDLNQLVHDGHLGLVGMQERMGAVGGTWQVNSQPGRGCHIWVTCPRQEIEESKFISSEVSEN